MQSAPHASRSHWRPRLQRALTAAHRTYAFLFEADAVDRIDIVKSGVPAKLLVVMSSDMAVPREQIYGWAGIARATANRKVQADGVLSQDEGERALGIARLIGQVEKVVAESGEPEGFDAARWTAEWLEEPNNALGGRTPGVFMDTADGREIVSRLVAQMQSGAYA